MRLFVAVNFSVEIKDAISEVTDIIKRCSLKGNITGTENFHLTLAFIGEAPSYHASLRAVQSVKFEPFKISIDKLGFFRRNGGDICYLAFKASKELNAVQKDLCNALRNEHVGFDEKEFRPHLTLAREFIPDKSFSVENINKSLPESEIEVTGISLMKSERINGKLTYTEISF